MATNGSGDPYEDYPDDQDPLSDGSVQEKPEVALRVAREIREIGNKLFKEGKGSEALNKYQSKSLTTSISLSSATQLLKMYPFRGYPVP